MARMGLGQVLLQFLDLWYRNHFASWVSLPEKDLERLSEIVTQLDTVQIVLPENTIPLSVMSTNDAMMADLEDKSGRKDPCW